MTERNPKVAPEAGDTIVVWFSHGAASAVAWKETVRLYGDCCRILAVNNPVIEEDEDNIRFGEDVSRWVGQWLITWRNSKYAHGSAVEVWDTRKAMSFPTGAPCTDLLKKGARQDFEREHKVDWHVLGFTADEQRRYERFIMTERGNVLPVLIEQGITKADCYRIITEAGLELPRVYSWGYPNANCLGCVKATSPTYWNHVRRMNPKVFAERAEQSRRLGVRLARHKGERVYLDELPEDAVGRPMKTMQIECGIFCEELSPASNDNDIDWETWRAMVLS